MKRLLAVFAACFAISASSSSSGADLDPLVERLREGGYVLYLRHTATHREQVDAETDDLSDCSQQRQLSELGRQQAARIGGAFRRFEIPVGRVLSSAYCRCVETARIAFGRSEVADALTSSLPLDEQRAEARSAALRILLNTLPADGSNDILVGHMSNLYEAVGVYPKPEGVVVVFKPRPGDTPELVQIVLPDDWPESGEGDRSE